MYIYRWPPFIKFQWRSPLKLVNEIQWNQTESKISISSTTFFCRPIGKPRWTFGLLLGETFWFRLWNRYQKFNETWQEGKIWTSSTKSVFFGRSVKPRWSTWSLIGWDIFDVSETTERNSTKLVRKQDLNIFYKVCFFRAHRKNKITTRPLFGWEIFDFFSETAGTRNSTKAVDRKQDLNVLYQVCVFRAERKNRDPTNKRWHFVLGCTIVCPLYHLFTSPLQRLNGFWLNSIGSKSSTSSAEFLFFRLSRRQEGLWYWCAKYKAC